MERYHLWAGAYTIVTTLEYFEWAYPHLIYTKNTQRNTDINWHVLRHAAELQRQNHVLKHVVSNLFYAANYAVDYVALLKMKKKSKTEPAAYNSLS